MRFVQSGEPSSCNAKINFRLTSVRAKTIFREAFLKNWPFAASFSLVHLLILQTSIFRCTAHTAPWKSTTCVRAKAIRERLEPDFLRSDVRCAALISRVETRKVFETLCDQIWRFWMILATTFLTKLTQIFTNQLLGQHWKTSFLSEKV